MNQETDIPGAPGDPSRRRLLYAGVAGTAALAGAGLALWKWRTEEGRRDAAAVLWPMNFDTPAGTSLAMQSLRGKPLVLNFWATWCPPCVEELPLLDGFYRENASKSWQVVGLAIDQPSAVRKFLERTPVSFPIALAGLGGTELGHALGNLAVGCRSRSWSARAGTCCSVKWAGVTAADLAAWTQLR